MKAAVIVSSNQLKIQFVKDFTEMLGVLMHSVTVYVSSECTWVQMSKIQFAIIDEADQQFMEQIISFNPAPGKS